MVCLFPLLVPFAVVYIFLGVGPVPDWFTPVHLGYGIYWLVGFVVLIADLWKQGVSREQKVVWTVPNLALTVAI